MDVEMIVERTVQYAGYGLVMCGDDSMAPIGRRNSRNDGTGGLCSHVREYYGSSANAMSQPHHRMQLAIQ